MSLDDKDRIHTVAPNHSRNMPSAVLVGAEDSKLAGCWSTNEACTCFALKHQWAHQILESFKGLFATAQLSPSPTAVPPLCRELYEAQDVGEISGSAALEGKPFPEVTHSQTLREAFLFPLLCKDGKPSRFSPPFTPHPMASHSHQMPLHCILSSVHSWYKL